MATALRLQAAGLSTVVLEAHGHAGGCAGYWRHRGFSFDVGATTLVDFEPRRGRRRAARRGRRCRRSTGEALPGYEAWLPDRRVTLHRDPAPGTPSGCARSATTGRTASCGGCSTGSPTVFWRASRAGIRMPMRRPADVAARPARDRLAQPAAGPARRPDARRRAAPARAGRRPALRGAARHARRGHRAQRRRPGAAGQRGARHHHPRRRPQPPRRRHARLLARRWSRTTAASAATCAPAPRCRAWTVEPAALHRADDRGRRRRAAAGGAARCRADGRGHLRRRCRWPGGCGRTWTGTATNWAARSWSSSACRSARWPASELTHHQLLHDYGRPLGDGNNMFVSVSAPGDTRQRAGRAPGGDDLDAHRHSPTGPGSTTTEYAQRKKEIGERLVGLRPPGLPDAGRAGGGVRRGHAAHVRTVRLPARRRRRRSAPDACATATSSPSRTTSAAAGCGWSATPPGPGWAPSPACWAAASSPTGHAARGTSEGAMTHARPAVARTRAPTCSARRRASGGSRWPGRTSASRSSPWWRGCGWWWAHAAGRVRRSSWRS